MNWTSFLASNLFYSTGNTILRETTYQGLYLLFPYMGVGVLYQSFHFPRWITCMYILVYVTVYVTVYLRVCVCMRVHLCMHVCGSVYACCVCVCGSVHVRVLLHLRVCACTRHHIIKTWFCGFCSGKQLDVYPCVINILKPCVNHITLLHVSFLKNVPIKKETNKCIDNMSCVSYVNVSPLSFLEYRYEKADYNKNRLLISSSASYDPPDHRYNRKYELCERPHSSPPSLCNFYISSEFDVNKQTLRHKCVDNNLNSDSQYDLDIDVEEESTTGEDSEVEVGTNEALKQMALLRSRKLFKSNTIGDLRELESVGKEIGDEKIGIIGRNLVRGHEKNPISKLI